MINSTLVVPAVASVLHHHTMPGITPSVISEPTVAAVSADVVDNGMYSISRNVNRAKSFDA